MTGIIYQCEEELSSKVGVMTMGVRTGSDDLHARVLLPLCSNFDIAFDIILPLYICFDNIL